MPVPQPTRRSFLSQALTTATVASLTAPSFDVFAAESKQPRIKVGQIGTAHGHAAGKMETFRKLASVYEVVGIVEPNPTQRSTLEKSSAYRDLPVMTEEQLLNTPGLQVVAIETEIAGLLPAAQRCVDAGMHIHLDKPAGTSLQALDNLLRSAGKRNLCVQMGYMFRYNAAFQLTHHAIQEGWLGDVFELHAVMSKKVGTAERQVLNLYQGGSMFELGCHLIDAMVWMLGKPLRVTPVLHRSGSDGLADNCLALCEYANGSATIRSSVIEPQGGGRRQFTVVGTEGVAEIRPLEPARLELTLERPCGNFKKGTQTVPLPQATGRYDGDLLDLAAVVRQEKSLAWDAAHDLAVQETVLLASGMPLNG